MSETERAGKPVPSLATKNPSCKGHIMVDVDSTLPAERWLPVLGYEGVYSVSDQGRTRREAGSERCLRDRFIQTLGPYGYFIISLSRNNIVHRRFLHHLVLEAFAGPRPPGMESRHLNGVRIDNRLENLCWGTRAENAADRVRHGTAPRGDNHHSRRRPETVPRGSRSGLAKLNENLVRDIRKRVAAGEMQLDIARELNVSRAAICMACSGKTWKHV
jgi:hypothetical protein